MIACLLSVCVLAVTTLTPRQAPPPKTGPKPEDVARVEAQLETAFRSGDAGNIQAALEAAQAVPHPAVVRKLLAGLEDERPPVQLATLQALRWLDHRDALEALHRTSKNRKWTKAPELMTALLRAIGQHADPSSIPVLAREPFDPDDSDCVRARLLGLARIRTREALEAVLGILAVTSGPHRRVSAQMGDVRLSLMLLTGVDMGLSAELWEQWWRGNRKEFRIPPEPPPLPNELRAVWDGFWGLPQIYARERRREDRGQEPERPRRE